MRENHNEYDITKFNVDSIDDTKETKNFFERQIDMEREWDNLFAKTSDKEPDVFDPNNQISMNLQDHSLSFRLSSTDPMDTGRRVYRKKSIDLVPGLNVLVGPNGAGKTTMLNCIRGILKKNNLKIFEYDNLKKGGSNALSSAAFYRDLTSMAKLMTYSEGESIFFNMTSLTQSMGSFVRSQQAKGEPAIILFDAIDSGLSIDFMLDIRNLFNLMHSMDKDDNLYIICTTNSYELAEYSYCWDVHSSKPVKFNKYEQFREFILDTRKKIEADEKKAREKEEYERSSMSFKRE